MGLPEKLQEKCKTTMTECAGKATPEEKKQCIQDKTKALEEELNSNFCDLAPEGTPEEMKKRCKEAQAKCNAKTGDEKATCYEEFKGKFEKEARDNMMKNLCQMVPDEAMKTKCKEAKAACDAKTGEEKENCYKTAMMKYMKGKKPGDGKGDGKPTKPGDGKPASKPKRKKRDIAQKGTDCTK